LIIGYTLTISVYAYAFGHYVAYAFGGGALMIRGMAIGAGLGLIGLNLAGLGRMTMVEVVIVSGNLIILVVLAVWGLVHWDSAQLVSGIQPRAPLSTMVGAAGIFVSYEGFQLLTYEYEEIKNGKKTFVPVLLSAAIFVVLVYVAVTLGATMLAGALTMVEQKQVALSVAAQRAYGSVGLVALTVAAAFATAAAINSTLYSTGKLAQRIARSGDLPRWIDHNNRFDVPDRPIVLLGVLAITLAVIGSLASLVEAASLVFLSTFIVVNVICFREVKSVRWLPLVGAGVGSLIGLFLLARLIVIEPVALAILVVLGLSVFVGRPALLRHVRTESEDSA
jgi:amino acid transporter